MNDIRKTQDKQVLWELYRIDDNGNEFRIAVFSDISEALNQMRLYESKGHKSKFVVKIAGADYESVPASCQKNRRVRSDYFRMFLRI